MVVVHAGEVAPALVAPQLDQAGPEFESERQPPRQEDDEERRPDLAIAQKDRQEPSLAQKRFPAEGIEVLADIDDRQVESNRETKSLGAEDTFSYDLTKLDEMNKELDKLTTTVVNRLLYYGLKGRTITLKIKYSDFKTITRSQSFTLPTNDSNIIAATSRQLLLETSPQEKKIRLLGITLSNFGEVGSRQKKEPGEGQLLLFPF